MPRPDEIYGAICLYIPPWMSLFVSGTSYSPTSGR